MKTKIIIGGIDIIVAGVGIYVLVKFFSKKRKEGIELQKHKNINQNDANKSLVEDYNKDDLLDIDIAEKEMVQTKTKMAKDISERHKEAGNIIKESITNIFNETASKGSVTTENDDKIDKMFDDLNNM